MGSTCRKLMICPCVNKKEEKKDIKEMQSEIKTVDNFSHMYDTVSDFPVYAVVNKSRPPNPRKQVPEESVQYAEIQVFSRTNKSKQKSAPVQESTEYATLNYPKAYDCKNGTLV